MEDVVHPLLQVRKLRLQPNKQALGDFTQEYTTLAGRVKEGRIRILKQLLREHIQHLIGNIRGRKDLVVGQICEA